jgi:hypothetical protein
VASRKSTHWWPFCFSKRIHIVSIATLFQRSCLMPQGGTINWPFQLDCIWLFRIRTRLGGISQKIVELEYGLVYKPGSTTLFDMFVIFYLIQMQRQTFKEGLFTVLMERNLPLAITELVESWRHTLNLADYDGGAITPNGKSVTLTTKQFWLKPNFNKQSDVWSA